jgi:hypothetical protein
MILLGKRGRKRGAISEEEAAGRYACGLAAVRAWGRPDAA